VVLPFHDRREGRNLIGTIGAMGRLTPRTIEDAATAWPAASLPLPPRVAVLLGGPSKSAGFEAASVEAALIDLAKTHTLLITPSRRTPQGLTDRLRTRLGPRAFVWDGVGANPYPAILGLADASLVTADSVNMSSEAASTGKPVHILPVAGLAPKLARFHTDLERHGASRPFRGRVETWSYPPLAEADRVAALICEGLAQRRTASP
ncbi:MAG: ELM1/GtrOC1 family putative glycosyltransferase, partial [Pseudomonadota bacterium]